MTESAVATITSGHPLVGRVQVPGDKSISHRALLLGAMAEGETMITGLSRGDDVKRTKRAVEALGVETRTEGDRMVVTGAHMVESSQPLDMGNSGTGIRLLAGVVAGLDGLTVLHGDRWLSQRPMDRVVTPLREMGAVIDGRDGGRFPPLAVRGGNLVGIDYTPPMPSAQVKSAVLLAGVHAYGATTIREPIPTRAHTEEMLQAFGADIMIDHVEHVVTVRPSRLRATSVDVPGDPSQAAFWVVAACIVPGSDVTVENVYVGRGRAGFVEVLRRMGADVEVDCRDETKTTADIRARFGTLKATVVEGTEVPGLIDEIPVLAVAAAYAEGTTEFRDAGELRVKETDRVTTTVAMLRQLTVRAEPTSDGLTVTGGATLHAGVLDSAGDHRIAMAAAVAGLAADGVTTVGGWEAVATSYPDFLADLERLTGNET